MGKSSDHCELLSFQDPKLVEVGRGQTPKTNDFQHSPVSIHVWMEGILPNCCQVFGIKMKALGFSLKSEQVGKRGPNTPPPERRFCFQKRMDFGFLGHAQQCNLGELGFSR